MKCAKLAEREEKKTSVAVNKTKKASRLPGNGLAGDSIRLQGGGAVDVGPAAVPLGVVDPERGGDAQVVEVIATGHVNEGHTG